MRNLTVSLLLMVLIATIGLGWVFDSFYQYYAHDNQQTDQDPIMVVEQLGLQIARTVDQLDDPQSFINQWPTQQDYTLSLAEFDATPLPETLRQSLRHGEPLLLETALNLSFYYFLPQSNKLLILNSPPMQLTSQHSSLRLLMTGAFYLTVLALMVVWLVPLAKRLLAIRKAATLFGQGQLGQRIQVSSISYIRDIEIEFNHMADRIEALVQDVKLLSSAVSHDLRTPLARIRFGIDTLQEEDDPIMRKRYEQRISNNVDEMVNLVETLLNYARLDQAILKLNKSACDLNQLIEECLKNKAHDAIAISFIPAISQPIIYGDRAYLIILLSNLIENALQYGLTKVAVRIEQFNNSVTVCIEDDGPGIAKNELQSILKPFIRGEQHRQTTKGFGIGLAIVSRICEWHQAVLSVENDSQLGGALFRINFKTTQNKVHPDI